MKELSNNQLPGLGKIIINEAMWRTATIPTLSQNFPFWFPHFITLVLP